MLAAVQVSVLIAAGVFEGRPARCLQLTQRRGQRVQAGPAAATSWCTRLRRPAVSRPYGFLLAAVANADGGGT